MMNLHESSVTTLTVKVSRGAQLCAPTDVQIIWDNLFFVSPLAQAIAPRLK
ncbi:hypothetical protein [Nostoc sp.]|uniref:hypothetical protein n=1 Tax=Nostoc sp. TaxID=1180 RepID=UPI002FF78A31